MKKTFKILGLVAGSAAALVLILALVISFLIPWDKVKDKLVEKASQELKREVKIESLSFGLFKGIELKGFSVCNSAGFSAGNFISAESAVLKYDFWALFRKQVKLTKIELVKPYILIEKGRKEKYNFSDLLENNAKIPGTAAVVPGKSTELPLEFSISQFALIDGTVKYSDKSGSTVSVIEVNKIFISVSGLSLESVKPFYVKASAGIIYNNVPLDLAFDGTMELKYKEQLFKATRLFFRIPGAGIDLIANLELEKFLENPKFRLDADVQLNGEKMLKLAGALAAKEQKALLNQFALTGNASLKFILAGNMVKTPKAYELKASGSGSADVTGMGIKYSTNFAKPAKHNFTLDYKLEIAGEKVNLDAGVKLKDSQFAARIEVVGFEAPLITAKLDGEAGIAEIYTFLPVMEGFEASGKVKLAGNLKVPVKKDYFVDYKGIVIAIKGQIFDFGTKNSSFNYGISKLNAVLSLTEKRMELTDLTFLSGTSPFNGTLSAANFNLETMTEWKTKFTGEVKFSLACRKFLIDELMDAMPEKKAGAIFGKEKTATGTTGGKVEPNPGFTDGELAEYINYINPGLRVDGKALLNEVVYKKVKLSEVSSAVKLADRNVFLDSGLTAYNGTLKSVVKIDLNTRGLGYELKADAAGIESGSFINGLIDSFLKPDAGGELKDKIYGSALGSLELKGAGANKKSFKKNLTAKLSYKMINGKLKNWKILGDALAALKLNRTEEINFREFTGKVSAANQKAVIEEFRIICDDMRYSIAGEVNYDRDLESTLNLKFLNDLAPNAAKQMGDLGRYGSDENGWFPVDFILTGTLLSPNLPAPILERSQRNLENKLKKKAEEELKNKTEDLKEKGMNLLKGLFGK